MTPSIPDVKAEYPPVSANLDERRLEWLLASIGVAYVAFHLSGSLATAGLQVPAGRMCGLVVSKEGGMLMLDEALDFRLRHARCAQTTRPA